MDLVEFVRIMPVKKSLLSAMDGAQTRYVAQNLNRDEKLALFDYMLKVRRSERLGNIADELRKDLDTAFRDIYVFFGASLSPYFAAKLLHHPQPVFYAWIALAAGALAIGREVMIARKAGKAEAEALESKLNVLEMQASEGYQRAAAKAEMLSLLYETAPDRQGSNAATVQQ